MLITHTKQSPYFSSQHFHQRAGLSLIEMLVALGVNAILLTALIAIFSSYLSNYNKVINIDTLNQQVQSAMQLMSTEIRRAGYWGNAASNINATANNNPFMSSTTDVSINTGNNCILFTYDNNKDGILPAISATYDDDRYGFRLVNQTLQARPPGAAFDCAAASTAWENVSNPSIIKITNLQFTLASQTVPVGQVSNTMLIRNVTITITAQVATDATITKTLTQTVRIRNDKYQP